MSKEDSNIPSANGSSWFQRIYENRQKKKEAYCNARLRACQTDLKTKGKLTFSKEFEVVHYLKPYLQEEEIKTFDTMKQKYKLKNSLVTVISLANIVVGTICIKGFMAYSPLKKGLFGVTIFLCSHISGMRSIRQETSQYNKELIEKYKSHFLEANLAKNLEEQK